MPDNFDRTVYTSIPAQLWDHYDRLRVERPEHRLVQAVRRQGAERTWQKINEIFSLASHATGLPPDQLFNRLGLRANDLDPANTHVDWGRVLQSNILGWTYATRDTQDVGLLLQATDCEWA